MDFRERSILQQKAHDTYKRNELIRSLHKQGENYAYIGRQFRLTRQAVYKIVREGSNH